MNKDEIERLIKESEMHAEDDKKKQERIEAFNKLDHLVYQVNKLMTENKDKLSSDHTKQCNTCIEKCKKILADKNSTAQDIEKMHNELNELYKKLGESIYSSYKKSESSDKKNSQDSDKKDYVDTDFKDVSDKK